jgi:hypothetical protein
VLTDPGALAEARRAGVRVLGRRCTVGLQRIALGPAIPVRLRDGASRLRSEI